MWKLIKSELVYNGSIFLSLAVVLAVYPLFVRLNMAFVKNSSIDIDFWGAAVLLFFYTFFYLYFALRIKEKRSRQFIIMPLSKTELAAARAGLVVMSNFIVLIYLLTMNYLFIPDFHEETGSIMMALGLGFIMINSFLILRDSWFWSFRNIFFRFTSMLIISIILFLILLFAFEYWRILFYDLFGARFGRSSFLILSIFIGTVPFYTFRHRRYFN